MHVQNQVAVVGDKIVAPLWSSSELHQLTRYVAARHRNDFDRQRECSHDADKLARIGDADKLFAGSSDDFLARQCAAAALDQMKLMIGFIRPIDIDIQLAG